MPIENERKIVLKLDTPEELFSEMSDFTENIEQIYLMFGKRQSVRIRKSFISSFDRSEWQYKMTFKQDVGRKTVEIETLLSLNDYKLLSKKGIVKLNKIRYRIGDWEIDFFKYKNKTYFVQAEIEMPEDQRKPDSIPPFIRNNLIHIVKRGDGRFSSKKLGNFKYAQKLLETLISRKQS